MSSPNPEAGISITHKSAGDYIPVETVMAPAIGPAREASCSGCGQSTRPAGLGVGWALADGERGALMRSDGLSTVMPFLAAAA